MQFRHSRASRRSLRLCAVLFVAACVATAPAPPVQAANDAQTPGTSESGATPQSAPATRPSDPETAAPSSAATAPASSASPPNDLPAAATGPADSAQPDSATGAAVAAPADKVRPEKESAPAAPDEPDHTATGAEPGPATSTAAESAAPEAVGGSSSVQERPATIGEVLGTDDAALDQIEAQIEAKEYDAAKQQLESRVGELERGAQRYDPALIRPLTLLGDANMGKERYVDALDDYQRATHLARVTGGLKTLDQLPIVYREAAALKALGNIEEANGREEYAYQILAGQATPDDPAILPAVFRLADWYVATGNTFAARALYERALLILEATGRAQTEAAIPALQGKANTYRLERFPTSYAASQHAAAAAGGGDLDMPIAVGNFPAGEQALQEVVRIRQQAAATHPKEVADAVVDLADWYTLFEKPARADPLYAHAFDLLGQIPDVDRVSFFAEPVLLYLPDPGTPREHGSNARSELLTGFVEVAYDVTGTGYVHDMQTVASEPKDLMDIRVRRSLRVARYRPALVDGVPVARAHLTYRYEFPYQAEPDEEPGDKPMEESHATEAKAEAVKPEVVDQ